MMKQDNTQGAGPTDPVSADIPVNRSRAVIWGTTDTGTVVIGKDGLTVHVFNSTVSVIWKCCDGTRTIDDIVGTLCHHFDVSPERARSDVRECIVALRDLDLIDYSPRSRGVFGRLVRLLSRTARDVMTGLSPRRSRIRRFMERYVRQKVCRRCGRCCNGTLFEAVSLSDREARTIADHLDMDPAAFLDTYCTTEDSSLYMTFPCPFLDTSESGAACRIYDIRPDACRRFPIRLGGKWRIHPGCRGVQEILHLAEEETTPVVLPEI